MHTASELLLLGVAVVIGLVHLAWSAAAGEGQRKDLKWNMGPRDEPKPPLTGMAGRLARAFANFRESFPLFAGAILAAYLAAKLGPLTLWGAVLYVVGRAIYLPLYAFGVPVLRTLVWLISMVGIVMILVALFSA
ncbi:MAG TPA: MAPEG family protein [Phenylobacterium sp.]|nr:MAPEG family protein [Phenylobacterium sp.]